MAARKDKQRVYETNADRQKAYRERKRFERVFMKKQLPLFPLSGVTVGNSGNMQV